MNKKLKTILTAGFLVVGMAAQACTLSAWDATTGAASGGPDDANVLARYSGLCSMDGTAGTVTNNGTVAVSGPGGEAAMIARFYFLAAGAGTAATLFETYSEDAATTPVYTVAYDGTDVTVTPAGGTPVVVAVGGTNWHSVEVKWASGDGATGGAVDVWVDSDATTAAADASTASSVTATSIQAAKLGGISNTGFTQLLFDSYESRRSTAIGRLIVGDANGDGNLLVDVFDLITVKNEILGNSTATGNPDCNESGPGFTAKADVFDLICVKNKILNGGI